MKQKESFREKLKSKKGSSVLEFAFGLLTFVLLAAFVVDVITIANKQYTVSQTANQLARQIAIQGGIKPNAPEGYPGGDRAYMDAGEMVIFLEEELVDAGIAPDQWSFKIESFSSDGHIVASQPLDYNTNLEVDYQNLFDFEIEYSYYWNIMKQVIPMLQEETSASQKRSSISEFKYANYNERG